MNNYSESYMHDRTPGLYIMPNYNEIILIEMSTR
jgi:hypothetical protein